MNKKPGPPKGNQNARREVCRVPLTIRLPADLIARLREAGNVTAQIESAIRKQFNEMGMNNAK